MAQEYNTKKMRLCSTSCCIPTTIVVAQPLRGGIHVSSLIILLNVFHGSPEN